MFGRSDFYSLLCFRKQLKKLIMKKELLSFVYVLLGLITVVSYIYEFIAMDKFTLIAKVLFCSYIGILFGMIVYETDPKKIFKKLSI